MYVKEIQFIERFLKSERKKRRARTQQKRENKKKGIKAIKLTSGKQMRKKEKRNVF